MNVRPKISFMVLGLWVATALGNASLEEFKRWQHFVIDPNLPGASWGTGGIGVLDCNGDTHLDVVISRRETQTAYWYERQSDNQWTRHILGRDDHLEQTLGAAVIDMDLDGRLDVVFWGVWFKHPDKADALWQPFDYKGGGHDIVVADLNGDHVSDLITYDGHDLLWFDPARKLDRTVILQGREDHGGTAPHGAGDLDGDGDIDLVIPGLWMENPGTGRGTWVSHLWPHLGVPKASYGPSMRSWVVDLNQDGQEDIVYSDCDTGWSHVYWVENRGHGKSWIRHQLPDPSGDARTGSFHSLGVADFDNDGVMEVFAGEQEDPDTYMESNGLLAMKPRGLKERGVIWMRPDPSIPVFTPVVIHTDNPGWHDAVIFDVEGDGDVDIVTKVWNKDGAAYHLDYWRNDVIPKRP